MTVRASILGAAGAMGSLFARQLALDGHHVAGFDLRKPADDGAFDSFVAGDVLNLPEPSRATLAGSDTIVICLPEPQAMEWVAKHTSVFSPGTLVVDTMSVKAPIARLAATLSLKCEYLSINPMFAPSLGFAGQKVVSVALCNGPRSVDFLAAIERWGSTVVSMDAQQHDRACAIMQVATHVMLLALGETVRDSGLKLDELVAIAPPPHLISLGLIARILKAAPETYWDIQRHNPAAAEARAQLAASLSDFDAVVRADDPAKFAEALKSMRDCFGPSLDPLAALAAKAIGAATQK